MKYLLAPTALACVLVALTVAGPAFAAPCIPTDLVRDNQVLTAQLFNPAVVTGEVDATGCDIGVYVNAGSTAITNADVHSARYFGVAVNGAAASATISSSSIHLIGDTPFNGSQHGVGVFYTSGATGSVDSSSIYDYQKNGTVFTGAGTNVTITNSNVTGLGPVPFIAQNGIQFSSGASGEARGNAIADNWYTGCSNQDSKQNGCTPFVSTGMLLFDVDPSAVKRSNNHYRDDQRNLFVFPS